MHQAQDVQGQVAHIGRLEVQVHDAFGVQVGHASCDVQCDAPASADHHQRVSACRTCSCLCGCISIQHIIHSWPFPEQKPTTNANQCKCSPSKLTSHRFAQQQTRPLREHICSRIVCCFSGVRAVCQSIRAHTGPAILLACLWDPTQLMVAERSCVPTCHTSQAFGQHPL